MTSTLASLYTINGESYKKFLQETLVSWFALFPVVRAAPQAGRASLAKAGDNEALAAVEEPDEGEEGCIQGEVPVM